MNTRHPKSKAFNITAFGSEIGASASALTESPNEGGTTAREYAAMSQSVTDPRLVIREYGGKVLIPSSIMMMVKCANY